MIGERDAIVVYSLTPLVILANVLTMSVAPTDAVCTKILGTTAVPTIIAPSSDAITSSSSPRRPKSLIPLSFVHLRYPSQGQRADQFWAAKELPRRSNRGPAVFNAEELEGATRRVIMLTLTVCGKFELLVHLLPRAPTLV